MWTGQGDIVRRVACKVIMLMLAVAGQAATAATAATPVDVIQTDLRPLIQAAASSEDNFAVDLPHAVSTASAGRWSVEGERALWHYAVRVPTAVSLSFHAIAVVLPPSAALVVRGASTTFTYRAADIARGGLWSRIQPGDTLELTLELAATDRAQLSFQLASVQAGYRSLGAGVQDHPFYRQLRQLAGTGAQSCVQNYMCNVTTANHALAQATVGVVVGNVAQCTGTLLNDVPRDNTPYILTARHCETGKLGGGNPGAAADVTVYWDATTPCGQTLGSMYSDDVATQTGALTIVEQQDAWLIQLDDSPVVTDAELAGFDATGGVVNGGYTVHHSEGQDKQFVGWYGNALARSEADVLGVSYQSNFWESVNQLGNIAPGASGSALVGPSNLLVGSLTLGRTSNDASGYEACPVAPLAAPNGTNGVADFTQLSAVWNSTADVSSSTGGATLQSVLDPTNTGTRTVSSTAAAGIAFHAAAGSAYDGQSVSLSWSVARASGCTAGGGSSGDGWTGALAASGTQSVTESVSGNISYTLSCRVSGGSTLHASVQVSWLAPIVTAQVSLTAPPAVWITRPVTLSWTSDTTPCSLSGGALNLSDLDASGSITTTQSGAGDVTYQISCGSSYNVSSASAVVSYVTPSLTLEASSSDWRLGAQPFYLVWQSYADSCTPSGGAPDDGWSNQAFPSSVDEFSPIATTAGTYTYTLTCTAGTLSVTQSVSVTYENDATYVNASVSPATVTYSGSPADYVSVSWQSNMPGCSVQSTPLLGESVDTQQSPFDLVQSSATFAPQAPGTYTISVQCASPGEASATSAPMTVELLAPPPPTATISVNSASIAVNTPFTVSWSSTYTSGCSPTGSVIPASGQTWLGTPLAAAGSKSITPTATGQYTLGVSCQSIDGGQGVATAYTVLSVVPSSVTLTASPSLLSPGQTLTLMWNAVAASQCQASGGGASGSTWSGALPNSGTFSQSVTHTGTFTYGVTCTGSNGLLVRGAAVVDVTLSVKGGGGVSDLGELIGLLAATLRVVARRSKPVRRSIRR